MADDFLDKPDEAREFGLAAQYDTVSFGGHDYHGMGPSDQLERSSFLSERIAQAVGFEPDIKYSYFRLTEKGSPPTVWIHADSVCAEYGAVLYLNLPQHCLGGTAFWTHNATGWDGLPEGQEITEDLAKVLNEDGNAQERWRVWTMNTLVGMKFNRFIAYPSRCFHSRYPRDGWGTSKEDARLVWVAFFDRKKVADVMESTGRLSDCVETGIIGTAFNTVRG